MTDFIPNGTLRIRRRSDHRIVGELFCEGDKIFVSLYSASGERIEIGRTTTIGEGSKTILATTDLPDPTEGNPLVFPAHGHLWHSIAVFPKVTLAVLADENTGAPDAGTASVCAFRPDGSWTANPSGQLHALHDGWSLRKGARMVKYPDVVEAMIALASLVFDSTGPSAHERLAFKVAAKRIAADLRHARDAAAEAPWISLAKQDRQMAANRRRDKRKS